MEKLNDQLIVAVQQKLELSEQLEQWQVSWVVQCGNVDFDPFVN